ncbi:MAG: pseudouridine synthase [Gemmatimonadota bacterium]
MSEGAGPTTGEPNATVGVEARDLFTHPGRWSRRELRRLQGRVETHGGSIPLGERVRLDGTWRWFRLQGCAIEARAAFPPVVLMDKAPGVVTSRAREGSGARVFDALDPALQARVEPVGRLDRDTTGLLIFVGDGGLIQHLGHPKRAVPRTYVVTVVGEPDPERLALLREGALELKDGHRPPVLALERLGPEQWTLTLTEGKYHEVKRIFAALGGRVSALRRTGFAGFTLEDLQGLPVRRLSEREVADAYAGWGLPCPEREAEVREVVGAAAQG